MILFVSYSAEFGGAERLLVDFATGLQQSGLGEELCLASPSGPLAGAALEAGLRVFPLRRRSLRARGSAGARVRAGAAVAAHRAEVRRLTRSLGPSLVIAWGMRTALALLLPRAGRSKIVFQHNDLLPGGPAGQLIRALAGRARMVIALSHAIAADLDPAGRLGERLAVVQPGVDVDSFPESDPPFHPPTVLVLGALVDWKQPDLALEAFATVHRRQPDARLRIVGAPLEGAELVPARLRQRAAEPDLAGAVDVPGPVRDPRRELAEATVLLHCAPREPFGMAVLEGLASGRPVVAPRSAGPREIVDDTCAVLYEPGVAVDAAEKLSELLADPERCRRLGAAGRARAASQFDRRRSRARYRDKVALLLEREAPRPQPDLAIVTVTHNSSEALENLLQSLERHLPAAQLVCADSASSDASATLARGHPDATVLELPRNRGFGYACDRAMQEVRAPVTALLNPDVELIDDSLMELAEAAMQPTGANRLLAPLVLYPDGRLQDTVHPLPASPADLVRSLIPPALLPGPFATALAPWRSHAPRQVGWAVGCALVAKTDLLRRLGPFDEHIFLYGEDLDLCLRAAKQGVKTWFCPRARVLHDRAHSTHPSFGGEPFELLARARHDVVTRRLGSRAARLDDVAQALTFRSRWAMKRLAGRAAEREQRQLDAVAAVRRAKTAR